jgi:metal-responsive CopG/Arc/MetJ family transcriptional regulator
MMYDDVIMRTIIDLPEEQVRGLAELCKRRKISRAEAVRRALARMLEEEHLAGRESVFGTWKKRDSRATIDRLRKEWTA